MNRYLVRYKVYSIPNNIIDMGQTFEFIYKTDNEKSLGDSITEYLCQYFYIGNFEIEQVIKLP